LADRIDKYLSDYFSGVIEMQIRLRIRELETPTSFDENIGGGKAENKRNIQTENDIIIQESDYILQSFIRDKWFMSNFLKVLTADERAMLELRYDRRRKRSWLQVASILSKSESQCYRDMQRIKQIYKTSVFASRAVDK
jgi:RinA family phage transcriptional activator